jgi:hypothetical protein
MRDKDRNLGSMDDMDSHRDRDWNGRIGSDSSERDDRMRNREDDYSPDMDEGAEDLQERQRQGNLGNERVRGSER